MKKIKFLDLVAQYNSIKNEINEAIINVINDSAFIGGKYVETFEKAFAEYHQAKYCIGVGNGTDAIEIALESLDLPKGGEVIVPANTFIATAEAVTRSGYKVVFCDCNSDDYTISIESFQSKITNRTVAVIPVHLYGHPCDMDRIMELSSKYNIKVIEDCAQAHGAEYKDIRVGTIGDIGTFSFYPGKNLGAYGDAGAIITNNHELSVKCKMIANHGRIDKYDHEFEGRNSRLDGIQAAILSVKLKHLEVWIDKRRTLANFYITNLANIEDIILPVIRPWAKHVFHLFVIRAKHRDSLKKFLNDSNIETGIHYPIALPKLKAYRYCEQSEENFKSHIYDSQLLSLPIGDHMDLSDAEYVVSKIKEFYNK